MVVPSLPDELWRRISAMAVQLQYPYTSQAPARRTLVSFETSPALWARVRRSGFWGLDGDWDTYISLKQKNNPRRQESNYIPIWTGWLMIALRHWIRRAVNTIKRRRLYDKQIGNPEPAYGIKYPW